MFVGLNDSELLREAPARVSSERTSTAGLIACIGEIDARRLFAPAGYPSMHAYCVEALHLSEDAASKRIHAARAARECPELLEALADGRLHLSGLLLLAPYINSGNAAELIQATSGKSKREIEAQIARRFPSTEELGMVCKVPQVEHAPGHVLNNGAERSACAPEQPIPTAAPPSRTASIAAGRYAIHASIGEETRERLVHLQELLSHRIPSGDLGAVLDFAIGVALRQAEKERFAATAKPRGPRPVGNRRTIPAHVRRAVRERDGGRCTFVPENGRRCGSRRYLEFDHVQPAAMDGESTVENLRLRCRTHNQLEAERVFGSAYMEGKRETARMAREMDADRKDLIAGLRNLGFRAEDTRRAVEHCMARRCDSLEERMRAALSFLKPRTQSIVGA